MGRNAGRRIGKSKPNLQLPPRDPVLGGPRERTTAPLGKPQRLAELALLVTKRCREVSYLQVK